MRIGASRSSSRRFSRMSRLSRLSRNSGSSSDGSSRTSLLVNSIAAVASVVAEQRPQDAAGDAFDEVLAVEERAAVDGEEPHARARDRGRGRRGPSGTAARRRPRSDASELARSLAQSISIALATSVATTVSSASSSGRTPAAVRSRSRRRRRAGRAPSRARRPGSRRRPGRAAGSHVPGASPPRSSYARRTVRAYASILPRLPTRIGSARGRGHADDALADADLGPDALGRVAVAGDRVEALAALVEQQQQRVLVAEELGEPVNDVPDEAVEVGAARQAPAQLGEPPGRRRVEPALVRSRSAGCAVGGRRIAGAAQPTDALELDDAVDVGAAQLEDALHPRERRDGVDVAPQAFEQRAPPLGALVLQDELVAVVGRTDRRRRRTRAGSRRGCASSSRRTGSTARHGRRRPCARARGASRWACRRRTPSRSRRG